MKNKMIMEKFDVLNEFTEMYLTTAFATALEFTGRVQCAWQKIVSLIRKAAERKFLEISILYGYEWADEGRPATSPDGILSHCLICVQPETTKSKKLAIKATGLH